MWIIKDWTGKIMFQDTFECFEDGEEFLSLFFENNKMDYEEWRQEYFIEQH